MHVRGYLIEWPNRDDERLAINVTPEKEDKIFVIRD